MLNFITQQRRGTTSEWESSIVVPRQGEIVLEECEDGSVKFKVGNGRNIFKDLQYVDELLSQEILNTQNRITELVKDTSLETNDLNTEVHDIRVSYDNSYYNCAGDAVRAIGKDVQALRNSLAQYIGTQAVDGLHYDYTGSVGLKQPYMLYLTANGEVLEESGVQIISGAGGGSGSVSSSVLKIGYVTTSPVVLTASDTAVLKFTFSGEDSSGDKILQASSTWKVNNTIVEYGIVKDGENEFDVTKYLKTGTTKVLLSVVDDSGSVVTKTWSVQQLDVRLESNFNDKYTYNAGEEIIFDYIPYGAIDKTVIFVLDGKEIDRVDLSSKISGVEVKYELPAQEHGSHLLDVYMESTVNDNPITSNHVLKDILWYDATITQPPVIGVSTQTFVAKQYDTTPIEYTVYDPADETPTVTIEVDDNVVSNNVTLTDPTNTYSYMTSEVGTHTIKITCKDTVKEITAVIEKLEIDVSPVTTGLVFDFNPVGRSNGDEDKLWSQNDVHLSVSDNFDWINGGYIPDDPDGPCFRIKAGTTATIDYKLFENDAKKIGKEFKLIFKTNNVANPDSIFLSCIDNTTDRDHIGIQMGVHDAKIYGQRGALELSYSEDDIIEFEFNISKDTDLVPIVTGYEDGVSSRPMVYDSTYNFKQSTPKVITLGSPDCDLNIYRFKVYNASLTSVDIMNNFIADARTTDEMISRYNRNQIYDENQKLDPDVLAEKCPWLHVYKLSAPHFTNNKSDKVPNTTIQQLFKNGDPVLDNWIAHNAQHSGQGTSSNNYGAAGRNLDFIMDKDDTYFELGDGSRSDKITLTRQSVPVAYLNAKVNIASSNNLTNAILAKRYNQFNPYRRPFVRDEDVNLDYIKDTMEFHNCVIFIQETDPDLSTHREFADTDWHFYAIGNIGDSKKTDDTRATDPNDKYECCVEIMDVGLPLSDFPADTMIDAMGYTVDDKTGEKSYIWAKDENLEILFEKQPDGSYIKTSDESVDLSKTYYVDILEQDDFSEDYTYGWRYISDDEDDEVLSYCKQKWIEFYRFVTTSSDEEFRNRLSDYFVVDSALFYYLFTTRYCMADNRAKNTFWHYSKTLDGTRKWDLCWDYDNDTSLGLNNYGKQVYRYGLEDIDKDESGEEIFRESDSTFFCRIRDLFATELKNMYNDLESKDAWHAESFIKLCDDWQNEFPEELWRIDIERKYIRTYTSSFIDGKGDAQFLVNMCNGRMKYHRRQWERSQEQYMSSKFQTIRASGDNYHANFRFGKPNSDSPVIPANYELTLTPYSYVYLNVHYGGATLSSVRAKPNVPTVVPYSGTEADIVNVYSASAIRDFGDLSSCYPKTVSIGNATRVKKLTLGNDTEGYDNTVFTTLTTGSNPLLEELNVENITSLNQSLELSKLTNLSKLYAFGTNIPSVVFAEGGRISYAELPAINNITLKNLLYLSNDNLKLSNYNNVVDLVVEECPLVDAIELLNTCPNLKRVRLINVDFGTVTYDYFETKIFNLKGINSINEETPNAWITGTVHISELTGSEFSELRNRYPNLQVSYDLLTCTVTFKDKDTESILYTQKVYNEASCEDPVTLELINMPVKDQTVSHTYTWSGWSKNSDGITVTPSPLLSVADDLILYPTFDEHIRQYTATFYNNDKTLLNSYQVDYGTVEFIYPASTPKKAGVGNSDNYTFRKWEPEPINIVGDIECYATYELNPDALYDIKINDIEYQLDIDSKTLKIINYKNTDEKIIRILDTYLVDGTTYKVTGILGHSADNSSIQGFREANLEYVDLPKTLVSIGAYSFYSNKNLTTITIPESVEELGAGAFADCTGLLDVYYNAISARAIRAQTDPYVFNNTLSVLGYTVHIGENVKSIPSYVFSQSSDIKDVYAAKKLEFAENSRCESIESYAFLKTHCTNVSLPESLVRIGSAAFEYCDMTDIVIPDNVLQINSDAFSHCFNLEHIYIPVGVESISSEAFKYSLNVEFDIEEGSRFVWINHCLVDTSRNTLLMGRKDSVIPHNMNITTIAEHCFTEVDIETLVIPEGVTALNQYAIYQCKTLTSIVLPTTLTRIESFALYGCSCYELILPMNLQYIGTYALVDNPNLVSITIPASVRSIGYQALRGCTSLTDVIFETDTLHIAKPDRESYDLFNGNSNLTHIQVNWASDGSSASALQDNPYPFEQINADAPWKAGTNNSLSQINSVTVKYTNEELVYNIDGTVTKQTQELSE